MNPTIANRTLTRRKMLAAAGFAAMGTVIAAEGRVSVEAADSAHNPLWIPPMLTGPRFDLTIAPATKQFRDGEPTATLGYNGSDYWGPTLVMARGESVRIDLHNGLNEETTTHWHGFHIPAEMDGGPHQMIAAGETWAPTFEVKNQASTYWYHPHLHGMTQSQLSRGGGGFIIVTDSEEAALALPRTYGVDDIPLALTSVKFDDGNAIDIVDAYGDYLLTNGVMDAEVTVPAQLVRFRILNAEVERWYFLGFSDKRPFHVIGSDGGLLNAPVTVTNLKMVPGERYEIVVGFSGDAVGSKIQLRSFGAGQAFGVGGAEPQTDGEFGSLLNNTDFDVLQIVIGDPLENGVTELPTTLAANTYWTAGDAINQRSISITDQGPGSPFTFDDALYEMDRIDQTVILDSVEAWTIQNGRIFGHSFHIHDVQFALVSRSAGEIAEYERGWKDTVSLQINEAVTFVAKFDDFASEQHPYMYHCHMSNHEDGGLMGQFLVVEG